ncbi:optineurin-like isoform X2 [Prorops nasuta]
MSNEDKSLSFVVLSKNFQDSIYNAATASYVDIKQKSISADYNSIVPSLSITEIQQKLTELLQENAELKQTLKRNNLSLKKQFNTLASWCDEITKERQNHKTKFAETMELINHLKMENTELKTKLSFVNKEGNSKLDCQSLNPSLQCEKVDEINERSITERLDSTSKISSILERINLLSDDEWSLLQQSLQNHQKLKDIKQQISHDQNYIVEAQKQLSDYNEPINELEMKLVDITTQNATMPKNVWEIEKDMQVISSDKENLLKAQDQVQKMLSHYHTYFHGLEMKLAQHSKVHASKESEELEQLKKLLEELKQKLEEERKLVENQRSNLEVEQKKLSKEKQLLEQDRINLNEEKTSLDQQSLLYESQEKSILLEKRTLESKYEQLLAEKNSLQEKLQNKVTIIMYQQKTIEEQADTIDLFRNQALAYKEDFTAEKTVKDSLIEEKSKLDDILAKQIHLNEQLQQEINRLKIHALF